VLHDLGRLFPTPCTIMLRVALLAWLLFPRLRLLHIRFHKSRRWHLLLFQFLDAFVSCCEFLLRDAQLLQGLGELCF
jgi:hypothetical protein